MGAGGQGGVGVYHIHYFFSTRKKMEVKGKTCDIIILHNNRVGFHQKKKEKSISDAFLGPCIYYDMICFPRQAS